MSTAGIYAIVHLDTGRRYVGSAVNIAARLKAHRNHLARRTHHNSHLQRAWDKYGEAAFGFSTLEEVADLSTLAECEQRHLDRYRPYVFNVGQFVGSPLLGVKRPPFSAQWRANLSAAAKKVGRRMTFEQQSAAQKGRVKSPAHRAAIGASNKVAHARPETKARMRAAALSREAAKRLAYAV